MNDRTNFVQKMIPKIGLVANSIKVFSTPGKIEVEEQFRALFDSLKQEGLIHPESIFYPERVFSPYEMKKAAVVFTRERVDAIIVLDSAFPNGNTFLTLANDPYLFNIPMIVTAPQEILLDVPEWTTNAWCGVIMNNYVAKRIGRTIFPLGGWPKDTHFQDELKKLLRVFRTIKALRNDCLGRFGDAPGGFHSASGNQLNFAKVFGTQIETIDWTAVMEVYRSGVARGYLGEVTFGEDDVHRTTEEMKTARLVMVDEEMVRKAARLYHSFNALIRANGFTSCAFRCWPEMGEPYIGVAPCFTIGWLLGKGDISEAGCEGDWPTAVAQSIGAYLSGQPSACLDFVNYTGGSSIVQLGHCGVGIPGMMASNECGLGGPCSEELKAKIMNSSVRVNDAIAEKSPDRQGGFRVGPALIGQFQYGIKTGLNLVEDENGFFKLLVFTGESRPDTARGILYSASDVEVKNYTRLNQLILQHGFSHHLAMAFGDVSQELKLLCDFYGIEYICAD